MDNTAKISSPYTHSHTKLVLSHETTASTRLWMGSIEHKGNNESFYAGKEQ